MSARKRNEIQGEAFCELIPELPEPPPLTKYTLKLACGIDKKLQPTLWSLESEGLNLDVFACGVLRLVEMERSRLQPHGDRNRRRNLKKTLECLTEAERHLDHGRLGLSPHSETLHYLRQSRKLIESDLNMWTTMSKGRGPTPETRILVALIACVREQTGKLHWDELRKLVSDAYRAAKVNRSCTLGQMKQLWKQSELRKNWRLTLLGIPPPPHRKSVLESARLRHTFQDRRHKRYK